MGIPWTRLAQFVPVALGLARELLDRQAPARAGAEKEKDVAARMAALEETQRRQAEAVHMLAEQTAALAEAAGELRRRMRTLLVLAVAAMVVAAAALVTALLR